jgi:hypothetical protein
MILAVIAEQKIKLRKNVRGLVRLVVTVLTEATKNIYSPYAVGLLPAHFAYTQDTIYLPEAWQRRTSFYRTPTTSGMMPAVTV